MHPGCTLGQVHPCRHPVDFRKSIDGSSALVGASVAKGPFSVRANYLYAQIGPWAGKDVPAGIRGEFMLSLNYTF